MRKYPVKYRHVRDWSKTRCINPNCGKWVELYQESYCPHCGKRTAERAGKGRCEDCGTLLQHGDMVCPFCGSKQRTIVEMRSIRMENLTEFAHLLWEAQPELSVSECRSICRNMTEETPYRISLATHPEKIRPLLQRWNQMGGKAAACLPRETSQRPIVLLRSYNYVRQEEYARLLFRMIQQTTFSTFTYGETVALLHRINRDEKQVRLFFTSGYDQIGTWVEAWRKLGGTAVRLARHAAVE